MPNKSKNGTKPNDNYNVSPYMRPRTNYTKWQSFKYGIWNPETSEFIGRSRKRWGIIFIYYVIFWAVLAVFFAINMVGLLAFMDDKIPYFTMERSLIGTTPGLSFRPLPPREVEGDLIWYKHTNDTEVKRFTDVIDGFLKPYWNKTELPGGGAQQVPCSPAKSARPHAGEVCAVPPQPLGPCALAPYGYDNATPCFYIKLNKIYDWVPEYYDILALPPSMPQDLKTHINTLPESQLAQVWFSCYGENPLDKESIKEIKYHPGPGIPGYNYPYTNNPGYLNPLLAIQVFPSAMNIIINIECRAWAKNIGYKKSTRDPVGFMKFQLKID